MFLRVTIAVCVLLLICSALFSGLPLNWLSVWAWLLFWVVSLASYARIYRSSYTWRLLDPLPICAITFLMAIVLPFDRASRYLTLRYRQSEYESIVQRIRQGTLPPLKDPWGRVSQGPHFSAGGNSIALLEHDEKQFFFFYEFASSDGPEGFVYVPEGGDPANVRRKCQHITDRWCYASK